MESDGFQRIKGWRDQEAAGGNITLVYRTSDQSDHDRISPDQFLDAFSAPSVLFGSVWCWT